MTTCFFCTNSGGNVLYHCELYRIILVDDANYPGYLRVVLNHHLKELTDLSIADNLSMYAAVIKCEQILRQLFHPEKINLASFGNMTPHVHWHVIPRFTNDRHFPNPTWGEVTNLDYVPSSAMLLAQQNLIYKFQSLFLA
jgi:diadenosine tetraphosphate (Ap4A) HIT family hydrolase